MLHSKVQMCFLTILGYIWCQLTHLLSITHTGNLITVYLSMVLHQTQYFCIIDNIICMLLCTQILRHNNNNV